MGSKKYDLLFSDVEKETIRNDYLNGASIRELQKKYNINCREWLQYKLLKGIMRNLSEASKVAHKKYPENFLHDEAFKKKMREIRLKFMKEHPEKTAWRKKNEPSYPEKCFMKFLGDNEYDKKYLIEREYPVFPYYIDFAFAQIKVAVEIDGSQHILDEDRVVRDKDKDETLISQGWKVLRVTENLVKTDWVTLKRKLDEVIGGNVVEVNKVGIFLAKKRREKVKRGKDGLSDKMRESHVKQRKVKNRPSLEEIEKLKQEMPMTKIGAMFGVSDNTVRKWIKQYKKFD